MPYDASRLIKWHTCAFNFNRALLIKHSHNNPSERSDASPGDTCALGAENNSASFSNSKQRDIPRVRKRNVSVPLIEYNPGYFTAHCLAVPISRSRTAALYQLYQPRIRKLRELDGKE